jgi:predicted DNA-binding helix-hairpin-helix protein
MELIARLKLLANGALQEQELTASQTSSGSSSGPTHFTVPTCFTPQKIVAPRDRHRNASPGKDFLSGGIQISPLPSGGSFRLLKVLQTNICEFDCFYCEHRASRDVPRTYVSPDEMAGTFIQLHRKGLVDGLFLSSGITQRIDAMQERMVQTAEILRTRYHFDGYVHLKILPGTSRAAVERTIQLANRVSLNLEAPTPEHLMFLSRKKDFQDGILTRMRWINQLKQEFPQSIPAGQITQFVVGAAGETDYHLLKTTQHLYREMGVRRAYFSAFTPVSGTPLDHLPPTRLLRQHRLYQADWLIRFYGFRFEEIPLTPEGNLMLRVDPKSAWALSHPEEFPLEVNKASYDQLIRVPGIGPTSARRIVHARLQGTLRNPEGLRTLGVFRRAFPYLLLMGKQVATENAGKKFKKEGLISQLAFWTS